jgi:hypothetical protein
MLDHGVTVLLWYTIGHSLADGVDQLRGLCNEFPAGCPLCGGNVAIVIVSIGHY